MATALKTATPKKAQRGADATEPQANGQPAGTANVQAKFAATRRELSGSLIERDDEADLVLTAMVCGEHCLLVGPPGTGKSLLLDSIMRWMKASRFSILLTKFTTPEEVFGPVSVIGLKNDQYRRVTTGMMPEADVCFADEIFKASSAILNTLLRMLNEREFTNGGQTIKVPLRLAVAASNEWPGEQEGGKELGALFDRFLFRKKVRPIQTHGGRQRLLWVRNHLPQLSTSLTPAELDQARNEAAALPWTQHAQEALEEILRQLHTEGIVPGDRRQFKAVAAAQAFAWLSGAAQVEPQHLEVLAHVLWDDPAEQPEKCGKIVAKIANPVGTLVTERLMEAERILATADPKSPAVVAKACDQLTEIGKSLLEHQGDPRADKARDYLRDRLTKLRAASMDAALAHGKGF